MIALVCAWALLFLVALPIGAAGIRWSRVTRISRVGDRFFLAAWLGFLTLTVLLLAWSLLAPITPWTGVAALLSVSLLVARSRPVRDELRAFMAAASLPLFVCAGLLVASVAAAEVQPICNRDVISYHADLIHTLSRIGVVPGLGLIHKRFGFISPWFTVPALFNHGPLTAHMTAVANGFAFLLLVGHLALAAWRILCRAGNVADWFALAALGAGSVFPIFLNDPVSSTSDFPNFLVTVFVAWAALIIYAPAGGTGARGHGTLRNEHVIPLYLAACLWTIKITTAPVLASMGLLYLAHHRFRTQAWLSAGLTTLVALPQMVALALVTGYPLYPVRALRLQTPWTLEAHRFLTKKRWGVMPGYDDSGYLSLSWFVKWLQLDATNVVALAFFTLSTVALAWIVVRHGKRLKDVLPPLLIGVTGLALLLLKSPFARFGWGYLVMLPATLTALYTGALNRIVPCRLPCRLAALIPVAGLGMMVIGLSVLGHTASEKRIDQAAQSGRITLDRPNPLLLPPQLPLVAFDDRRGLAVPYEPDGPRPVSPLLAGPRPMFYPLIPREGVSYRIPAAGPAGGFVHANPYKPGVTPARTEHLLQE